MGLLARPFAKALVLAMALAVAVALAPRAETRSRTRPDDAAASRRTPAPPLALSVVWYDPYDRTRYARRTAAAEIERLFAPLGVPVRVASPLAGRPLDAAPVDGDGRLRVRVLVLPVEAEAWGLARGVLGATIGDRGGPLAVYVFEPSLRRALGAPSGPAGRPSPRRNHETGIALGRVVAHEIVHVFAPRHPHAEQGLMRRHLDRRALLGRGAAIDAASAARLRAALRARVEALAEGTVRGGSGLDKTKS